MIKKILPWLLAAPLAACGGADTSTTTADRAAPPVGIAFVTPAQSTTQDGTLYFASGGSADAVEVGPYSEVTDVPGADSLMVRASTQAGESDVVTVVGGETVVTPLPRSVPDGQLWSDGHGGVNVVQGRTILDLRDGKSTSLAVSEDFFAGSSRAATFDGHPRKGLGAAMAIRTGVVAGDKTYVGLSDTSQARIAEVTTGARLDLDSYGAVQGLSIDDKGHVYVLAWDDSSSQATIHLLELDPDLTLIRDLDTGLTPNGRDGIELLRATISFGDAPLVSIARAATGGAVALDVLAAEAKGLRHVATLTDAGLEAVASAGGARVYGGPGKGVVGQLDLRTGSLVASSQTAEVPEGAFIAAVS